MVKLNAKCVSGEVTETLLAAGLFLLFLLCDNAHAIRWLALKSAGTSLWNSTQGCRDGRLHYGLLKKQARLCKSSPDSMPHVVRAASSAVQTCQYLLQDRRWNCSSIEKAPFFTPDLTTGYVVRCVGTREQGFVYALSSAAVTYAIARACAAGTLFHCACATPPQDPPNGNFKWGGCGDNYRWGAHFAKQFVNAADKQKRHKLKTRRKHDEAATMKDEIVTREQQRQQILSLVNLHNNRVGRRAVERSLQTQCKCHGVSGSCNIKTCWRALPARLHDIGARLARQYSRATEVRPNFAEVGRKLLPVRPGPVYNHDDLLYVTKSPDYCHRDHRVGSVGTYGRQCNTSSPGYSSCDNMCCGRGYTTAMVETVERCQCKYYWCCYVKCKTCRTWVQVNRCN